MSSDIFVIYQIDNSEKNREYRCRSYEYQIQHGFMAASIMCRKSPGALVAGGRCWIGCISSRLSGGKKTMHRSRSRKEVEKVKMP